MAAIDSIPLTLYQRVQKRKESLYRERSSWDMRWLDISRNLLPFNGRFQTTDRNRGDKTFNNIIDESAQFALDILTAGMMSGTSSPARPWFRAGVADEDLMESNAVKLWLSKVTKLIQRVFRDGNTYRSLHSMYEELGAFGTAADIISKDYEYVIWHDALTAGEFAIATDRRGRVNTIAREYEMTVEQLVEEFVLQPNGSMDWSRVSPTVKNMWDSHNYDKGAPVVHLIQPRAMANRDMSTRQSRQLPRNMPWQSVYIESGKEAPDKGVLRDSGYRDFPGLGVRWHTRGGDVYGVSPGMKAIGSIKQLQQEQMRKAQAIDYMARPPVAIPGELKGREIDALPGGMSYFNLGGANAKIQNLYDVRIELQPLLADIQDVRTRINKHFFADLFIMIANSPIKAGVTASEIAERHEEKLLMLGPVLERLHDELLSPLIDITFSDLVEAGAVPPPPPELENQALKIEFISVLAQAQRAVGLGALDRLLGTVGNLATASGDPGVWDKINKDDAVERYADMLAIDPELIVSSDQVAYVRQARAQQQQAAAVAEAAPQMAQAAKSAAEAQEISAGNPAGSIEQFTGYTP